MIGPARDRAAGQGARGSAPRIALAALRLALALLAGLPGAAAAECTLAGRVLSGGQGLAGVAVRAGIAGSGEHLVGITNDGGHFSGRAPRPPARTAMALIYRKQGYVEINRIHRETGECPAGQLGDEEMEASGQGGGPTGALTPMVLVAPYALYGGVTPEDGQRFNETLELIIGHRILSFRSGLQVRPLPPEPSVRRHTQALSMVDRQMIRDVGARARAVAVVIGEGELVNENGAEMYELSSEMIIIARHPAWEERRVAVDDRLPRSEARPSRLSRNLGEFWGQKAVIALIVHELAALPDPAPAPRLDEIRRWLVEVRATMTADNPLLPEVNQLLQVVVDAEGPA